MEKIDLTKCNNCRFRAKDEDGDISGRIRVSERGAVYLFVGGRGNNGFLADRMQKMGITDFEIVPRDLETYKDWQVGDVIGCLDEEWDMDIVADHLCRVIFRSGELVAIAENYSAEEADINGCYTCSQLFREGWRLVLTDIEKQIIEERKKAEWKPQDGDIVAWSSDESKGFAISIYERNKYTYVTLFTNGKCNSSPNPKDMKIIRPATDEEKQLLFDAMAKAGKRWNAEKKVVEDIPEPYEFKKGEPVLVRKDNHAWVIRSFLTSNNDLPAYETSDGIFMEIWSQCIPYNEDTMHLLGTSNDYVEK